MIRIKNALCLITTAVFASTAAAAIVTVPGSLFDVEFDDTGYIFQVGTFINDDGIEEPLFDRIGGYTILDATTIRYFIRPEDTFPDLLDPTIWEVVPGGDIEVGGVPGFSTDSASDMGMFRIIPKPGTRISGVDMMANGVFDNPTEDASLLYSESLMAGGDSDAGGLSLGIFSAGPIPSGLSTSFPETMAAVDAEFDFSLDGSSSDPFAFSFASIGSIDFVVTAVPEPCFGFAALLLSLFLVRDLRRA